MAKITKKQEATYLKLIRLHHELIKAKHFNDRKAFEETIKAIREEVKENDEE